MIASYTLDILGEGWVYINISMETLIVDCILYELFCIRDGSFE
jgi:hypothetical protein